MLKYLQGKVSIKKDGKGIAVIMSDETLDRHGDVLSIDQWDLTKFMMSPRMLVDHNHEVSSIVGRWENTRIEGKQLVADANFHDYTDLAVAVKKMVENEYLDTVSVGFIPKGPVEDGGKSSFELIETSWVTVPANPSARTVKDLMSKQTPKEQLEKVSEFIGEKKEEEKVEEKAELIISTIEQFKVWKTENPEEATLLCEAQFISKLIQDSEQLKTLTAEDKKKVEIAQRQKLLRLSLKAVASHTGHLLREMNK
jgi:hypothetical protein